MQWIKVTIKQVFIKTVLVTSNNCLLKCGECNNYSSRNWQCQGRWNRSGRPGICRAKIIAKKKKIKPTITPFIVQACVIWNLCFSILSITYFTASLLLGMFKWESV